MSIRPLLLCLIIGDLRPHFRPYNIPSGQRFGGGALSDGLFVSYCFGVWSLRLSFFVSFDTANIYIYIALNGAKHNVSPFSGFIFWLRLLPHFQQQKIPVAGIFNYCVENINPESLKHRPTKMANKYCGTVFVCVFFLKSFLVNWMRTFAIIYILR